MSDTADVTVDAGDVTLEGVLGVPEGASGVVVFAHGAGSSRHSPQQHRGRGDAARPRAIDWFVDHFGRRT